jgi:hypothetical protein
MVHMLLKCLQGEVFVPIGLVQYPGLSSGLFAATASGKPALSRFKVLARHKDSTLAEVSNWGLLFGQSLTRSSGLVWFFHLYMCLHAAGMRVVLAPCFHPQTATAVGLCCVQVTILTGRPHQIRIHMAALGHPLVGDPLYGPGGVPKVCVDGGMALI